MDSVVTLSISSNIATVQMADRQARNTFSKGLVQGLIETFQKINSDPELKVVVIHGYDTYFCCGGTQDELLKIVSGTITFDDLAFYRVLLDCPLPTIAAMQGHAIGGGLAVGSFADMMVLAEESMYSTNFMKYGFTPGMGATYLIPKKFGESLGNEMLFTARNYHGSTLKARGVSMDVVKRSEVIAKAQEIAQELSSKPRESLILLKEHLSKKIKAELSIVIEQELAMHSKTFAQAEVKVRIETLFGK
jgi:polyketide biosynthesis enoyl-CoA hydratase PksI